MHERAVFYGRPRRALALLFAVALASAPWASPAEVRDLIEHDRWQDALEQARALAASVPGADATAALGEALYRAGRIDEAGDALAPLAGRDDAPPRVLAQLGLVRSAQGKDEEAVALLARAAAGAPQDPWVVYRAAGGAPTRAKAIEMLRVYLDRAPGDDPDRREGAKGTIDLYTALGERKVWIAAARPERLEIPLQPLAGTDAAYVVEATLSNKKKIRLLLDTGSTGLFVVERAVKKGGLTPLSSETVFAGGGEGRTKSSKGLLATLSLGELTFRDALVTTTTSEFDPQGRFHGVLGVNVLQGYRVTLDLAARRLTLEPPGAGASGAPYWDVGGQMLVRASATGGGDGLFLLDTGAVRSMIGDAFAKTIPAARTSSDASVRTYGGNVRGATLVRGVELRFGDLTGDKAAGLHAADLTQRSRLGGVEVSGFLGMDLLAGKRIVIDTMARRVDVGVPAPR